MMIIKLRRTMLTLDNVMLFIFLIQRLNPDFNRFEIVYSITPIILSITIWTKLLRNKELTISGLKKNFYTKWLIVFTLFCFLSYSWSIETAMSLFNFFIVNLFILIPYSFYLNNKPRLNEVMKTVVFSVLFTCVYFVLVVGIPGYGSGQTFRLGSEGGWNSNDLGLICSISALFVLYLLKNDNINKIKYIIIFGLFVVFAVFTGSRKVLIIISLGIALYYYFNTKSKKIIYLICSSCAITLCYYLIMNIPVLYNVLGQRIEGLISLISTGSRTESSAVIRWNMILYGLEWFKGSPFLGYGIDNFRYLWERVDVTGIGTYAHNNYVELLVDLGIIGTTIYYALYIKIIRRLFKSIRNNREVASFFLALIIILTVIEIALVSYNYRFIQIILCLIYCGYNVSKKDEVPFR